MGAVAAIVTPSVGDTTGFVEGILTVLQHRGRQKRIWSTSGRNDSIAIGMISHRDIDDNIASRDESAIAVDGSLYGLKQQNLADKLLRSLSDDSPISTKMKHLVEGPGGFASVFYINGKLGAIRDINGFKPLYIGKMQELTAFASERKALWKLGCADVTRVSPGRLYSVRKGSIKALPIAGIPSVRERQMTMKQATTQVTRLLRASVHTLTRGINNVAVAFSGGLDSSLTAFLARRTNPHLQLLSVGLEGSVEPASAERFAKLLDLPIVIETEDKDALEDYIRRIVWLIEEPSLMKVSIAVPLHWAARLASKQGVKTLLCGQGSDELFGGYYKYAQILDSKGRGALRVALRRSVIQSCEINYERDDQACSPFDVELRTPFTNADLVRFSLTIPSELKVRKGNDTMRKWVLRNVAKRVGLPDEISWRRKKAIQHGTGVESAIRKLAKRKGLSVETYLQKVHAEVINMDSMP